MKVVHLSHLPEATVPRAYALYFEAFKDLAPLAVQRHLMTEDEFTTLAYDTRITKILIINESDGGIAALSAVTTDLSAWPLIEPAYFQRLWPREYADGRIWYLGFLLTDRHPGLLEMLLEASSAAARARQGIVFTDFCDVRVDLTNLPQHCLTIMHRTSGTDLPRLRRMDAQSYWKYDFRPDLETP